MRNDTFTVLIADGLETDRDSLKQAIAGHAPNLRVVGEVEHGEQLVEYLSGENHYADRARFPFPDLLVVDLHLPRKDGLKILIWLRTQVFRSRLKVAILADPVLSVSMPRAARLGAIGFYPKRPRFEGIDQVATSLQNDFLNPPEPVRA